MDNMELTKQDMLKYFDEINNRLNERKVHGEIVMAGGAALTLVYDARNSTQDIDAAFSPKEEFREIIKSIGNKYNLKDDWLNDGVKGFFTDKMKASVYKEYSNLTVLSMDAESLLAMKLTSARSDTKDAGDSITLMKHLKLKNIGEAFSIIEKYAHRNRLTAQSKFFTIEVYAQYEKSNTLMGKMEAARQLVKEQELKSNTSQKSKYNEIE